MNRRKGTLQATAAPHHEPHGDGEIATRARQVCGRDSSFGLDACAAAGRHLFEAARKR